jgi:YD repeat-containing protein
VTVADQLGKTKKSETNALGQVTKVYEDPSGVNWLTTYDYDALGDLTKVTQGNQPVRIFFYDSLKRLLSTSNPENGTTAYTYDKNGNLETRLDANGITTTVTYDALNRPIAKTYNDSPQTATIKYWYDAQTLPSGAPSFARGSSTGRLVGITYGNTSAGDYFAYDALGQETLKIQQTGGVNYQTSAGYSISGALNTETYPSGRTVSYAYDQAGRTTSVSGTLGDGTSRTYSSGIIYSALVHLSRNSSALILPSTTSCFTTSAVSWRK